MEIRMPVDGFLEGYVDEYGKYRIRLTWIEYRDHTTEATVTKTFYGENLKDVMHDLVQFMDELLTRNKCK